MTKWKSNKPATKKGDVTHVAEGKIQCAVDKGETIQLVPVAQKKNLWQYTTISTVKSNS